MASPKHKGDTNVTPAKRNTSNDRNFSIVCADRRSGDPMKAYLGNIELEVDFQTYGPEPSVGLDGGFDIERIYAPKDPHGEDVSHWLSQEAIEEVYAQVETHIRKMKYDYQGD